MSRDKACGGVDVAGLLDALAAQRADQAKVSASTLNLVAFVEDKTSLDRVIERTLAISHKHPSRTILLDGTKTCKKNEVHAECSEVGGTLLTQCEHIHVCVNAIDAPTLRSSVHALLVPNVQTALLWAGEEAEDPRFKELATLAQTIVVDTSRSESTARMRELVFWGSESHPNVRDLAYLRLLPWQDMVAQFFDDPELASELTSIAAVEVVAGSEPEAYYFIGWLASRLRWKLCGKNEFCNPDGGVVRIQIQLEGEPRRVRRVSLRSSHCVFSASLDPQNDDVVCLTVTGEKPRVPRCSPLHDVEIVSLIEQAILIPRNGAVFIETQSMVRTLLAAGA